MAKRKKKKTTINPGAAITAEIEETLADPIPMPTDVVPGPNYYWDPQWGCLRTLNYRRA